MLTAISSLVLATAFQIGPFYEQKSEGWALRPVVSVEAETTDVLWPLFTAHRDWWRFAFLAYYQDYPENEGYQFTLLPIWFNGRDTEKGNYWGLFPLYGSHPHIATLYDFKFVLWPLWMRYRVPRPSTGEWLTTDAWLFPFFSHRSDGSWGLWPLYGVNHQRESDHRYVLWPIVTWAQYREDRDTAGEGASWMVWPLYGQVRRDREKQDLFLPPLFSYARTRSRRGTETSNAYDSIRVRAPWPFFEYERSPVRRHLNLWPFYERSVDYDYQSGEVRSAVTRWGWKLVELYDDETRVFPFYASGRDHFRIWPFYESERTAAGVSYGRFLALMPIRWVSAIDRNWSKYWTFYERAAYSDRTEHSLLWGIIRWKTKRK